MSQPIKPGSLEVEVSQLSQPKEAGKVGFVYSDVSCNLHFVDGFQNDAALEMQELEVHIHPQQTVPRSTIARFSISISSTAPLHGIRNVE
jgi:hypothetical protein